VMIYGVDLLMAAIAFTILQRRIIAANGQDHTLAHAIGADTKGKLSLLLYAAGIGLTLVTPTLGLIAYLTPALMWLIPDTRIARLFEPRDPPNTN